MRSWEELQPPFTADQCDSVRALLSALWRQKSDGDRFLNATIEMETLPLLLEVGVKAVPVAKPQFDSTLKTTFCSFMFDMEHMGTQESVVLN